MTAGAAQAAKVTRPHIDMHLACLLRDSLIGCVRCRELVRRVRAQRGSVERFGARQPGRHRGHGEHESRSRSRSRRSSRSRRGGGCRPEPACGGHCRGGHCRQRSVGGAGASCARLGFLLLHRPSDAFAAVVRRPSGRWKRTTTAIGAPETRPASPRRLQRRPPRCSRSSSSKTRYAQIRQDAIPQLRLLTGSSSFVLQAQAEEQASKRQRADGDANQ